MRSVGENENAETEAARLAQDILDRFGPLYIEAIAEAAPENVRHAFEVLAETAEGAPSDE